MRIEFDITEVPHDQQRDLTMVYLEGDLRIYIHERLFFNQPYVMLMEFAFFAKKWIDDLRQNPSTEFIYTTMDHEEPVLTVLHSSNGEFKFESIWQEVEVLETVPASEVMPAFTTFFDALSIELDSLGIDIFNEYKLFVSRSS